MCSRQTSPADFPLCRQGIFNRHIPNGLSCHGGILSYKPSFSCNRWVGAFLQVTNILPTYMYGSSPQRQVKLSKNYAAAGSGYKGAIPHCSGKFLSFHFSSTYYVLFAAAVKKVHLPLRVVPITYMHCIHDNAAYVGSGSGIARIGAMVSPFVAQVLMLKSVALAVAVYSTLGKKISYWEFPVSLVKLVTLNLKIECVQGSFCLLYAPISPWRPRGWRWTRAGWRGPKCKRKNNIRRKISLLKREENLVLSSEI